MWICWYASVCVCVCVCGSVLVNGLSQFWVSIFHFTAERRARSCREAEERRMKGPTNNILIFSLSLSPVSPLVLCSSSIALLHLCTRSFILIWSHPPPPPLALYLFPRSVLGMCSPTSTSNPSSSPLILQSRCLAGSAPILWPSNPLDSEHHSLVPRGWHQPRHL